MKRTASFLIITIFTLFGIVLLPDTASAEVKNSINVETNTGGTTCINGNCTTNEGSSKSHVCVNGKCWDSSDGNVDYKSEDGNTKVTINNNSGDSSVSVQNNAAGTKKIIKPTITPKVDKEEIKGIMDDRAAKAKVKAEQAAQEARKKIETHKTGLAAFIEDQLTAIQNLLDNIFGKK